MSKKNVNKRVYGPLDYVFIVVATSLIISPIFSINGERDSTLEKKTQETLVAPADATQVNVDTSNYQNSTNYSEADSSYITQ